MRLLGLDTVRLNKMGTKGKTAHQEGAMKLVNRKPKRKNVNEPYLKGNTLYWANVEEDDINFDDSIYFFTSGSIELSKAMVMYLMPKSKYKAVNLGWCSNDMAACDIIEAYKITRKLHNVGEVSRCSLQSAATRSC